MQHGLREACSCALLSLIVLEGYVQNQATFWLRAQKTASVRTDPSRQHVKHRSSTGCRVQRVLELMCEPTCMVHPPTYLNKVLIGCADGSLHLWNVSSGARIYIFRGWNSPVATLAPSPALDTIGVGLADGSAVITNVKVDEVVMRFGGAAGVAAGADKGRDVGGGLRAAPAAGACSCLAFRCAWPLSAIAYELTAVCATHAHHSMQSPWKPQRSMILMLSMAEKVCRTDNGTPLMAAAGASGVITVWNLAERRLHTIIRRAHGAPVTALHFFAGEPVLMSSGADNTVNHWIFDNADGSARRLRFRAGHAAPPRCVQFYGVEGRVLLTAAADRSVRLFSTIQDQQSRELSQVLTIPTYVSRVSAHVVAAVRMMHARSDL